MNDNRLLKIENMIYVIRGQKVMLDSDLAELYGVLTKNHNKAGFKALQVLLKKILSKTISL